MLTEIFKHNITKDYIFMKARMRKRGVNEDLEIDELREVISNKVTNFMVEHLSKQNNMKIVNARESKRSQMIPTLINLGGNTNNMLLDLNFGDENYHRNHIKNLFQTAIANDFKLYIS